MSPFLVQLVELDGYFVSIASVLSFVAGCDGACSGLPNTDSLPFSEGDALLEHTLETTKSISLFILIVLSGTLVLWCPLPGTSSISNPDGAFPAAFLLPNIGDALPTFGDTVDELSWNMSILLEEETDEVVDTALVVTAIETVTFEQ